MSIARQYLADARKLILEMQVGHMQEREYQQRAEDNAFRMLHEEYQQRVYRERDQARTVALDRLEIGGTEYSLLRQPGLFEAVSIEHGDAELPRSGS